MQRMRHARFLARLVLAWFALAIGVAVAAPVVQPQTVHLLCSGAVQLVNENGEEGGPVASHALECPLCAVVVPPPPAVDPAPVALPLAHVLQPIPAARHAARIAAPLPARGPPQVS